MMRVFILGVGVLGVDRCVEVGCCTSEFKCGAELTLSTTAHRVQGVGVALFCWVSGREAHVYGRPIMMLVECRKDAGVRTKCSEFNITP